MTESNGRNKAIRLKSGDDPHLHQEWLLTNGLGGYASGTVSGELTRRYHGLLIAALPNPLGRHLMLTALSERCQQPGLDPVFLSAAELWDQESSEALMPFEFASELGLPQWKYQIGRSVVEKRLLMLNGQNTILVSYRLREGSEPLSLDLAVGVNFRSHDGDVNTPLAEHYQTEASEHGWEICAESDGPVLRIAESPNLSPLMECKKSLTLQYATERHRGYPCEGYVFTPGYFRLKLKPGEEATIIASAELWEVIESLAVSEARSSSSHRRRALLQRVPPALRIGIGAELVIAADQFIIKPRGRLRDEIRASVSGDDIRTVIAGYHWFTDWGRDTMISLEGLTLTTGRAFEARWILHTFAHYVKDGLIPNMFPEGTNEGLYHTADATLWFFHALSRYWQATGDDVTLRQLFPILETIVLRHIEGTHFGIHVDKADGLLVQGAHGYQLTWMDAKVDGWVVTPRRGKAVEINALWYNALCLMSSWKDLIEEKGAGREIAERAGNVRSSFNRRFWNESRGCLFDVIDGESGDDPACRPNQVFAISLPHEVLERRYWSSVMETVERKLLTPVGLRSLAPDDPNYKPYYHGDLHARDAAYHQGPVWGWLIGHYIDAWLKLHPGQNAEAQELLAGYVDHLNEASVSSISEIFDAEPPHTPRGCIAQAWSVAEVLRGWAVTSARPETK